MKEDQYFRCFSFSSASPHPISIDSHLDHVLFPGFDGQAEYLTSLNGTPTNSALRPGNPAISAFMRFRDLDNSSVQVSIDSQGLRTGPVAIRSVYWADISINGHLCHQVAQFGNGKGFRITSNGSTLALIARNSRHVVSFASDSLGNFSEPPAATYNVVSPSASLK
jgi:hypothetical protein